MPFIPKSKTLNDILNYNPYVRWAPSNKVKDGVLQGIPKATVAKAAQTAGEPREAAIGVAHGGATIRRQQRGRVASPA